MPRLRVLIVVLALAAFVGTGCGNSTKTVSQTNANGQVTTRTVPNVHFAKTKFVLHAGLAFGAFHRYIYKPFKQGTFKKGAAGRTKALIKGGAAGLFAAHELKKAREAALSDDRLRPLADGIGGLGDKLGSLAAGLKGSSFNPTDIVQSAGAIGLLRTASKSLGVGVKDVAPPSLGG